MKHKITLLFLLLTLLATTFAQIPSYVPSNGLVGWWPFNGNANDESGNGNNGTVNGATLTADRFGVANKAYSFDGVNDYIEVLNSPQLNSVNNFTLSIWVFFNDWNQSSSVWFATIEKQGQYSLQLIRLTSNTANLSGITVPVSSNSWNCYTLSFENNIVKVYANGTLQGSNNNSFTSTTSPLVFGIDPGGQLEFLNGSLDDIGIWNRALTECEIKDLYYAQLGYSTVDAGADQTICRGDLVTLQGAGGSSLAWDNGVIDGVPFEPTQSGAYVLTGADSLGCIGTDTVQVSVLENASSTINQTAIDSYTLNGQTYTQSGTYTQVVPAANGCDSVITLNLELDFTGIQSHTNTSLQLYPNPVKDVMTLVGLKGEAVSFAVYSVDGKLIKSGQTTGEIQLEDLKKGNYILKIDNDALPFVKM
ncbi:MAG: hypothetical protein RLZZ65_99 [Bacteroidota bacterium]|jgi:hypothetical protein